MNNHFPKMIPNPHSQGELFFRLMINKKKVRKSIVVRELKNTVDYKKWHCQREKIREVELKIFIERLENGTLKA